MSFSSLVAVKFGPHVHHSLGQELLIRGLKRVFIITDEGLKDSTYLKGILSILKEEKIETGLFSGVRPNPNLSSVQLALGEANSFNPQGLVAFGGGSVLDTAKAMGIWYRNQHKGLWDLVDPSNRIRPMLPVVTIPTTAGTGSEVSSWAVITHDQIPEKVSIGGEKMAPLLALVDPVLTLTLPPKLTLWTGLDALTHAIEAFLAKGHPFIKDICMGALKGIFESLPWVLQDGTDVKAREGVMLGSLLAGWAMENGGLGLVHGMSHQVSAFYDYQHGLSNALLLPYVLAFNRDYCQDDYRVLNEAFGGKKDLLENLKDFYGKIGFSHKLTIKEKDLPSLTQQALDNINTKTNPKPVDREMILGIYQKAFLLE